jgi:tRNA-Thr(GGU) m(6)t(6)A37 methyltransferase TsaA
MDEVRYKPIGIVHSPFITPKDVPKESEDLEAVKGSIEVTGDYEEGLNDIDGFSHIVLIFHFHLSKGRPLVVKPYWDRNLRGVFSTRSPARPNPIGITVVRLLKREGNILHVQGLDMVEGTPVLDIKPFVPEDRLEPTRIGWLEKALKDHEAKRRTNPAA